MTFTGYRRFVPAILALALAGGLQAQAAKTYAASSVRELLRSIGSDRTIVLKKGDYVLDSLPDYSSANVEWLEADDGSRELGIRGVRNLTIRGAEGTRFVSRSSSAYLLGLYECSSLRFDNIDFLRELPSSEEADAGLVYAESCEGLGFDRSSFTGPMGYPLELWECSEVSVTRSEIGGASSGALYAGYVDGLDFKGNAVSGCQGWPLLYIEESDFLNFEDTRFEGNQGGTFIDIWSAEDFERQIGFQNCSFVGNEFEWFSGAAVLPYTEGCEWIDDSFDEDWMDYAVAPAEEEYYGEEGDSDLAGYWSDGEGLSLGYPEWWTLDEDWEARRFVFSSPDEEVMLWLSEAMALDEDLGEAQAGPTFERALSTYSQALGDEFALSFELEESLSAGLDERGLLLAEYAGTVAQNDGSPVRVRLRLIATGTSVWALTAFSTDPELLAPDSEADLILASLEFDPGY